MAEVEFTFAAEWQLVPKDIKAQIRTVLERTRTPNDHCKPGEAEVLVFDHDGYKYVAVFDWSEVVNEKLVTIDRKLGILTLRRRKLDAA